MARGEDLQLLLAVRRRFRIEREANAQSFRAADPILLHQSHFFRPALEPVERGQQIVREGRDLEEPLRELALLHRRARAPAAAVDDLLVGQHGLIDRIPIDLRLLALHQARAQEVQKHLLLMFVVAGIAGRELAGPVERQPHRFELRAHGLDVGVGPLPRVHLVGDGGVLGRHAERVPTHRMQDVETAGAHEAGDHVAHGVVAHVPHVDAARRIGKHFQHVVFGTRIPVGGAENAPLFPYLLPARLGLAGVVALRGHRLG